MNSSCKKKYFWRPTVENELKTPQFMKHKCALVKGTLRELMADSIYGRKYSKNWLQKFPHAALLGNNACYRLFHHPLSELLPLLLEIALPVMRGEELRMPRS